MQTALPTGRRAGKPSRVGSLRPASLAAAALLLLAGCSGPGEPLDEVERAKRINDLRKEANRQFALFRQSAENPEGVDFDALKKYVDLHGETTRIAPATCPRCYMFHGEALHRLGLYYKTLVGALENRMAVVSGAERQELAARRDRAQEEMLGAFRSSTLQFENYFDSAQSNGEPINALTYYGAFVNSVNVEDYNRGLFYLDLYAATAPLSEEQQKNVKKIRADYQRDLERRSEERLREELDRDPGPVGARRGAAP